jgi:hypothetical protein
LFQTLAQEKGIELWTGALQRAEVVFFMRPGEVSATMSLLSRFKTAPGHAGVGGRGKATGNIIRRME